MRTLFSTTVISDDNLALGRVGFGSQWNGQPVMDVVQFFKAANATVYGRAKGPQTFALNVWRTFASEGEALLFACTHADTLPLQADLLLTDRAYSVALRMAEAVPSVAIAQRIGVAVLVQYTFTGSRFLSEEAPDGPTVAFDMKLALITVASGAEEIDVVYAIPALAAARYSHLTIEPPLGQLPVDVIGYKDSSETGFTAILAAALPAAGYRARYMAIFQSDDSDQVKFGTVAPAAAAEEIAVVFAAPFGFDPRYFHLWLQGPAGQPAVAVVGYKDVTEAGFTAILSAALPASGYTGRYIAML